ncbi:catalytic activity protein [[Candida] boidinii]|nr:catalytic activity protein [[Candida] boidinii]OWB72771.1 catalytic activity protein [[Candida] boidinii]
MEESGDSSSFQSVLENLKRLREKEGTISTDADERRRRAEQNQAAKSSTTGAIADASNNSTANRSVLSTASDSNSNGRSKRVYSEIENENATRSTESAYNRRDNFKHNPVDPLSNVISKSTEATTGNLKYKKEIFRSIQVNRSQNGNPLLTLLKDVSYEYNSKIKEVDYLINSHCYVLFLSLKYHKLHPEYIYTRLKKLSYSYNSTNNNNRLGALLLLIDIDAPDDPLRELNKICLLNDLNLIVAWTFEECSNYLSYMKRCELNTGKKLIKGGIKEDDISNDSNYYKRVIETLTSIRSINKTDSINLISKYGTVEKLVNESNQVDLQDIQGMGKVKIDQLLQVFNDPFIYNKNYDN